MGRKGAEAGSADAVRMPGSPVPCAVWVPQVGGESHLILQVSSLLIAALSFPPPPPLSLSLLSLSMKKPVSGKALCLSEKHILQEPSYEC